jgi:hypothetical protein
MQIRRDFDNAAVSADRATTAMGSVAALRPANALRGDATDVRPAAHAARLVAGAGKPPENAAHVSHEASPRQMMRIAVINRAHISRHAQNVACRRSRSDAP